jgi:hypothetical protein
MSFKKDSGRQQVIYAEKQVTLADLVSGADLAVIDVPKGARMLRGGVVVDQVFNSTSSDVIDIGDSGSENRYLNDANGQSAALTALVPTGYVYTANSSISARWTSGGGTPTTGKFTLFVEYAVQGRAQFAQGLGL